MSVPFRVDDGKWKDPLLIATGCSRPFCEVGDEDTFVYKERYSFDKDSTFRQRLMSSKRTKYGTGYVTYIGDLEDMGDGTYQQDYEIRNVPRTRDEPADIVYTQQFYREQFDGDDVSSQISETTRTFPGFYRYEYYLNIPPFPLLSPKYIQVFEQVYIEGATPASSGLIVARDSEVGIYAARIYYRKTPYIQVQVARPSVQP